MATGRRLGAAQAILVRPLQACSPAWPRSDLPLVDTLPLLLQDLCLAHPPPDSQASFSQRPSLVPYVEVHSPPSICCALSCFMYLFSRLVPIDSLCWFPHWAGGL